MSKVLFLDIDGVLWTMGGVTYNRERSGENHAHRELDPVCLSYLQKLCRKVPDLRIVVSSSWRHGTSMDEFKEYFGPIIGGRLIGATPSSKRGYRGYEIKAWLDKNPAEVWAIVDDDSDMWPVIKGFFKTSAYDGIKWNDYVALERYFLGTDKYRRKVHLQKTVKWICRQFRWWLLRKPMWELRWKIRRIKEKLGY